MHGDTNSGKRAHHGKCHVSWLLKSIVTRLLCRAQSAFDGTQAYTFGTEVQHIPEPQRQRQAQLWSPGSLGVGRVAVLIDNRSAQLERVRGLRSVLQPTDGRFEHAWKCRGAENDLMRRDSYNCRTQPRSRLSRFCAAPRLRGSKTRRGPHAPRWALDHVRMGCLAAHIPTLRMRPYALIAGKALRR